jgi:hypothetical protein
MYAGRPLDRLGGLTLDSSWTSVNGLRDKHILRIGDYARERHVNVVPRGEFFGHLLDPIRAERYASLASVLHGGDMNRRKSIGAGTFERFGRTSCGSAPSGQTALRIEF